MKNLSYVLIVAIVAAFALTSHSDAGDLTPLGKWQTVSGESRYEVINCGGGQLCARLTWLRADARTEENLQYLNKYVMAGARQTAANKWRGKVLYDGDSYGGSMILVDTDKLKLRGCAGIFCQSMEFVRI